MNTSTWMSYLSAPSGCPEHGAEDAALTGRRKVGLRVVCPRCVPGEKRGLQQVF